MCGRHHTMHAPTKNNQRSIYLPISFAKYQWCNSHLTAFAQRYISKLLSPKPSRNTSVTKMRTPEIAAATSVLWIQVFGTMWSDVSPNIGRFWSSNRAIKAQQRPPAPFESENPVSRKRSVSGGSKLEFGRMLVKYDIREQMQKHTIYKGITELPHKKQKRDWSSLWYKQA